MCNLTTLNEAVFSRSKVVACTRALQCNLLPTRCQQPAAALARQPTLCLCPDDCTSPGCAHPGHCTSPDDCTGQGSCIGPSCGCTSQDDRHRIQGPAGATAQGPQSLGFQQLFYVVSVSPPGCRGCFTVPEEVLRRLLTGVTLGGYAIYHSCPSLSGPGGCSGL